VEIFFDTPRPSHKFIYIFKKTPPYFRSKLRICKLGDKAEEGKLIRNDEYKLAMRK